MKQVLFSVLIFALMTFTILYTYQTLLLFAEQADAWDQLHKFIQSCTIDGDDDKSFEKLGKFIESAKETFNNWNFIVKEKHETSKKAVIKVLSKRIFITTLACFLIPQLLKFIYLPRTFGLEVYEDHAAEIVSKSVSTVLFCHVITVIFSQTSLANL